MGISSSWALVSLAQFVTRRSFVLTKGLSPSDFAAAQQNAAATQVQSLYRRNQGKKAANEMRVQRRFMDRRKSSMTARAALDPASEE